MARTHPIPEDSPPAYPNNGMQRPSIRTNPSNFSQTAEILVGPNRTRFLLHTSLLINSSPYFRAALTGPFLESATQSLQLPDVSLDVFELCVSWLYTSTLPPPYKDDKPAYYTLLHLYLLADRLCLEALRNTVTDTIALLADRTNSVLTPSDTRILYEQVADSAPLRKLVLDLFAFKKTDKLLREHEDRWHAAFLRDLAVHLKTPCRQAMQRHAMRMWIPDCWSATRACEGCRCILPPRYGAVCCGGCGLTWCVACVSEGTGLASWEDGRGVRSGDGEGKGVEIAVEGMEGSGEKRVVGVQRRRRWESCKPWRAASRCLVYHEHKETERCEAEEVEEG
ncbi:hypothetical protein EJ04DRAFT_573936 [Polyplosphaeria fusca]|uniref:BTB domain-containing protein n=1 Tax=Polyplosphaeria fusca TaxID=682080 RepID=A0A9P4R846_9PLEO|nr:hypothetical protein EJ04DRAFT_573936 [Polyplosphaeria fusca]